ncbi:MAG: hypothetical protein QF926_11055 [Alphaproteobacteria bacterium]|nr:hypothetical protein [Alphaproteobacteria bacterium]MDP6517145.1 hypothetical protein [Alphaproteobacteria bacterium]
MNQTRQATIDAGVVTFSVRHEQWDGNIHGHPDQGVVIQVEAPIDGAPAALLRFNCFDVERSYVYDPERAPRRCVIDPVADGNPIGWSLRQLRANLGPMLRGAGHGVVADAIGGRDPTPELDALETAARTAFLTGRRTVKHNRGTEMFEAGNIRFGLEMRALPNGDGGLAIHVLADLVGAPGESYTEETELLAFDCFREEPHYHYGPRNKNHRIFWDKTLVPDTLEWTLSVLKAGRLRDMIAAAGYRGVAADIDDGLIAASLPGLESQARAMQPKASGSA